MRKRFRIVVLVLLLSVVSLFAFTACRFMLDASNFSTAAYEAKEWNLILVNRDYPIPDTYDVQLITLSNGQKVDDRIYPALQQMFDDARSQGIYPVVLSGYRTNEEQAQLMANKIKAYEDEGYQRKMAVNLAESWVSVPGTSEHELGMAVDINANKEVSANEEVHQWLAKHAYKYGFILRYPPNKTHITGISHEPWHYRYVGTEAAMIMYEEGLCLEEYLLN